MILALAMLQMTTSMPIEDAIFDQTIGLAQAVLYSPDTKVPRSAEVALRRAIPALNSAIKKIQDSLEDILFLLRIPQRKPFGTMEGDVKKALKVAMDEKAAILALVPVDEKERGAQLFESLISSKGGLQDLLGAITDKDPDKVSVRLVSSLEALAQFELLQAPGLPYLLPGQYQGYPRLTGRAVVEFTLEKGDGSSFTVAAGGGPKKQGTVAVVLDGYSAPLTSGNFADLVSKGAYDGITLRATEQAVLSDTERNEMGTSLPIEIMPAGEFQPLYHTTLNVQDGELPVLPLSVYGAVAMAHSPSSEDYSAPSQFFFYLYDRRSAGLGGLSFDEGQFSVFGYVTNGKELLSQIRTGDIIQSAKLVSGADRLIVPSVNSS